MIYIMMCFGLQKKVVIFGISPIGSNRHAFRPLLQIYRDKKVPILRCHLGSGYLYPKVGQTLECIVSEFQGEGTLHYQWVNSRTGDISGATDSLYTITSDDLNCYICCRVSIDETNGQHSNSVKTRNTRKLVANN